jgi:MarR family 2-MHQ and catechol resistance regulon transcriptional repressor
VKHHPAGAHLFLVLSRANRAMDARARDSIEGTGLCASDFGVMEALLHKGPQPVNALGKLVLLTSGSMTAAVDRLTERGLVARANDPNDRRVRVVALTAEGRRLIKPAFVRHQADLDSVVSVLTPQERTTLVALLRKLGKSADGTSDALEEAS